MKNRALIVKNLHFQYSNLEKDLPILKNINFELKKGELASLIGPSGCGKSTLLRILSGLEFPSSGNIYLNEHDITKTPANQRSIGMVFQDYALFPHLTSAENILIALNKNSYSNEQYQNLIHLFQIQDVLEKFPHQISGGQMQRVAIVRTLIRSPEIILLDEPFSGLDRNLKKIMAVELRNLFKSLNTTAIMVTHDQEEAFSFSDKIGVMLQGHISDWGTPFHVYSCPSTKEVALFLGDLSFVKINRLKDGTIHSPLQLPQDFLPSNLEHAELLLRPEHVEILHNDFSELEANALGIIKNIDFRGRHSLVKIQLESGDEILAVSLNFQKLKKDQTVYLKINISRPVFF